MMHLAFFFCQHHAVLYCTVFVAAGVCRFSKKNICMYMFLGFIIIRAPSRKAGSPIVIGRFIYYDDDYYAANFCTRAN